MSDASPLDPDDTTVIAERGTEKGLGTSVTNLFANLERRLQPSRGQTTTEWIMIAGVFTATAMFLGRVMPGTLKAFVWGLSAGIKSLAP